ncbi:hypothetical protein Q0O64_14520, partial [Staphylococcus aureus]|nr:hypothetical protein [Staphylococcus aureus]
EDFVEKPIPEGVTVEVACAIISENIENHRKKMAVDLKRENAKTDRILREINQRISQQAMETKQLMSQTESTLKAQAISIADAQSQQQ